MAPLLSTVSMSSQSFWEPLEHSIQTIQTYDQQREEQHNRDLVVVAARS